MIEMGRVAGSYGIRGWIRVEQAQQALPDCRTWWIGDTAYPVEQVKEHSGTLLAQLGGLKSREAALKLKGSKVFVQREALPKPAAGHYYLADLVGLEVVNERGEALGVVKQWLFNGAQDVMEVAGERTYLVPWIPTVVRSVDLPNRRIEVEWGADW
jgi:16S rRNA processing protein RimM